MDSFDERNRKFISKMSTDSSVKKLSEKWYRDTAKYEYEYHFTWLGQPIIQLPQDIVAMQEIIYRIKPDLIIETGVARGGSAIFYSSMLELIGGNGQVLSIDIDIREHNRIEIEKHQMFKRIKMLEGDSTSEDIIKRVYDYAEGKQRILVVLDSNHTHIHVMKELQLYSPLVNINSYMIVLDTVIEDMPDNLWSDRPWGKGNNPKTAVHEFLKTNDRFVIDKEIEKKILITVAPDGYLLCIKD